MPDVLPDGRHCRYIVPENATGSQALRPFIFGPSTNSDLSQTEAEHGGLPIPLCIGNCGNYPCCVRLPVATDIQLALRNRGQQISDFCCGGCVLCNLYAVDAPEIRHRTRPPRLQHGPRCPCYNQPQDWQMISSTPSSPEDTVMDDEAEKDGWSLLRTVTQEDVQYTSRNSRVLYTGCRWCQQSPASHHEEDCPKRHGRVEKNLAHLDPCWYCGMSTPDHYGKHCMMKSLFWKYDMDKVWRYDPCFYCHDANPDHPGRKCPQFSQYWKEWTEQVSNSRARSRSRAASTTAAVEDGYEDLGNPDPGPPTSPPPPSPCPPIRTSSSSSSSASSSTSLPAGWVLPSSLFRAKTPFGPVRIYPCVGKTCKRLAAQGSRHCCKMCFTSSSTHHSCTCEEENFPSMDIEQKR